MPSEVGPATPAFSSRPEGGGLEEAFLPFLQRVSSGLPQSRAGQVLLAEILSLLSDALGTSAVAVVSADAKGASVVLAPEDVDESLKRTIASHREEGVLDWVAGQGTPLLTPDLDAPAGVSDASVAVLPIRIGGETVAFAYARTRGYRTEATLESLCLAIALAYPGVHLAQASTALERQSHVLSSLIASGQALASIQSLEELTWGLLEVAVGRTHSHAGLLLEAQPPAGEYAVRGVFPADLRESAEEAGIPLQSSLPGLVERTGRGLRVSDYGRDPRFSGALCSAVGTDVTHAMAAPLSTREGSLGVVVVAKRGAAEPYTYDDLDLLETLSGHAAAAMENAKLYAVLKATYLDLVNALVSALEARDEYTAGHSVRVAEYSRRMARVLGFAEAELELIHNAGVLHDVGKIGIPDAILLKRGSLNDYERAVIKTHPVLGYQITQRAEYLSDARAIIGSHHERVDGQGYPEGLHGDAIPLMARIAAVADAFDAMTTARPYRGPFSEEEATSALLENRGTQFDANVADVFVELLDKADPDYRVWLRDYTPYLRPPKPEDFL